MTLGISAYSGLQQTKILIPVNVKYSESFQREKIIQYFHSVLSNSAQNLKLEDIKFIISSSAVHEFYRAAQTSTKKVWVTASSTFDQAFKHPLALTALTPEVKQLQANLKKEEKIKIFFNKNIFLNSDSRDPTQAGMMGAVVGSLLVILISTLIALPIGVMSAFCLEELVAKNKLTSFIEVSIDNLSATPAIIFGILGLSIYVNILGIPRGSVMAGGLTLSLVMLPTLVITTRLAIRSVPDSIKQGALALGASKVQVILHHILPLSIPRVASGTLIGITRVLGESAPLLMIGMVAFIADIPRNILEPATVFPVQIYIWSKSPDPGFAELNSVIILILLLLILSFNVIVNLIRKLTSIKIGN